jgi:hypothetical protein
MVKRIKKINIKEIFKGLQNQMEAKLTFNRKVVNHPTAKGTATELEWAEMLSTYLPRRYCVECAFVIDSVGNISEQIDLVIFDRQYSPFILKQNGVTYIPAECVYAVIEVKQNLSKQNIKYAQDKAASVRKLKRTSAPIPHAGGVYDPKKPARILAGLVALEGTITKKDKEILSNAAEDKILNFGCSLTGKTYFSFPELHPWDKNDKPYKMLCHLDENSLVNFFMNFVYELQKVGTVAAIDINAYLK